jgi:hypothetical protein
MTGTTNGEPMNGSFLAKNSRWALLAALVMAALLWSGLASAQSRNTLNFDDDEEIVIRGEVDKPEAFYILAPSNLNYQTIDPETSFLDELYETTEEESF